jgi:hypothetical protein
MIFSTSYNHFQSLIGTGFYTVEKFSDKIRINPKGNVYAAVRVNNVNDKSNHINVIAWNDTFSTPDLIPGVKAEIAISQVEKLFGTQWEDILLTADMEPFAVKIVGNPLFTYIPTGGVDKFFVDLSIGSLIQLSNSHAQYEKKEGKFYEYNVNYIIGDVVRYDKSSSYHDLVALSVPGLIEDYRLQSPSKKDEGKVSVEAFSIFMAYLCDLLGLKGSSAIYSYRYEMLNKINALPVVPAINKQGFEPYNLKALGALADSFFTPEATDKKTLPVDKVSDSQLSLLPVGDNWGAYVVTKDSDNPVFGRYISELQYASTFGTREDVSKFPEFNLSEILSPEFPDMIPENVRKFNQVVQIFVDIDFITENGEGIFLDEIYSAYVDNLVSSGLDKNIRPTLNFIIDTAIPHTLIVDILNDMWDISDIPTNFIQPLKLLGGNTC